MKTNLTIEIESGLLDAVTQYAKSKGQSVSEVLNGQFRNWPILYPMWMPLLLFLPVCVEWFVFLKTSIMNSELDRLFTCYKSELMIDMALKNAFLKRNKFVIQYADSYKLLHL